jgi:hypothetical protein
MCKKTLLLSLIIFFTNPLQLNAQKTKEDSTKYKFFIGSTLFVLLNLIPDNNSPGFVQLNLGYRLSPKDALSIELKTWKYAWPLGIPYGKSFEAPKEKFPGYIREYGFAMAYQRFLWKGLYSGVHVMSAWQSFINNDGLKINNGFQVFNTYRLGYQVKIFKNRFFIEPSVAITHRLYHTPMPPSFGTIDDKWSKLFFGEPGIHFGINF